MTFEEKIKNAINYKVTKKNADRSRVKVTFQFIKRNYKDPYDASKGISTKCLDVNRDMYMTDEQIKKIKKHVEGK